MFGGDTEAAVDQLPHLEIRGVDLFAVGARGGDAACEVDAGGGGAAGDEAADEGDLGEFVVDWVEGCGEDVDEDVVCGEDGGRGGERGGGVEFEVAFEGGGCAGELPGFHCGGEGGGGHCCFWWAWYLISDVDGGGIG